MLVKTKISPYPFLPYLLLSGNFNRAHQHHKFNQLSMTEVDYTAITIAVIGTPAVLLPFYYFCWDSLYNLWNGYDHKFSEEASKKFRRPHWKIFLRDGKFGTTMPSLNGDIPFLCEDSEGDLILFCKNIESFRDIERIIDTTKCMNCDIFPTNSRYPLWAWFCNFLVDVIVGKFDWPPADEHYRIVQRLRNFHSISIAEAQYGTVTHMPVRRAYENLLGAMGDVRNAPDEKTIADRVKVDMNNVITTNYSKNVCAILKDMSKWDNIFGKCEICRDASFFGVFMLASCVKNLLWIIPLKLLYYCTLMFIQWTNATTLSQADKFVPVNVQLVFFKDGNLVHFPRCEECMIYTFPPVLQDHFCTEFGFMRQFFANCVINFDTNLSDDTAKLSNLLKLLAFAILDRTRLLKVWITGHISEGDFHSLCICYFSFVHCAFKIYHTIPSASGLKEAVCVFRRDQSGDWKNYKHKDNGEVVLLIDGTKVFPVTLPAASTVTPAAASPVTPASTVTPVAASPVTPAPASVITPAAASPATSAPVSHVTPEAAMEYKVGFRRDLNSNHRVLH